jgi:hypothetical protein
MKFFNKNLDSIAGKHAKVLVFDCEFWHILGESGDNGYKFPSNLDFFFMPREVGGFLLTKNTDGSWNYKNPFFVTLSPPKRDVAFPISHYSTVSGVNGHKLDDLEKKLGLPWGESFPSKLTEEGKQAHAEGLTVYESDPYIKKHHKAKSWYTTFMKDYAESLIIVKGKFDMEAFQNAAKYYKFEYKKPKDVVDIADWNEESRKRCKTAKLEGSYLCVESSLDKETKELAKVLPLEKAHDPSTDASMTLLIALYIESQKP